MDKIHINELALWSTIGINAVERQEKQALFVDVTLSCNLRKAGKSDELTDTIDYRDVCATIRDIGDRTFSTVEGLAETIANTAKQKYPISAITVHIKKPGALVRGAKYAAIEITR